MRLLYPLRYVQSKNGQRYWYHSFNNCNIKSSILGCFFISYKCHPDKQNFQFPARFRCMKFWKFHFRFLYIASKDEKFNFRGSPNKDFQDPSMVHWFVAQKSILTSWAKDDQLVPWLLKFGYIFTQKMKCKFRPSVSALNSRDFQFLNALESLE